MRYTNIEKGTFISRPNRFVANVDINGKIETVHVKNTGRCKELLLTGCKVILEKSENPNRKTKYDLIAVYKENLGLVNIDSQAPNKVVKEWLESRPELFNDITLLKPEYTYGKSRIDFYLECGKRKIFIEVKGCTLEINGLGYFPDAPTERGVKHLNELANASEQGFECYIAFAITMPEISKVFPNNETHRAFGEALNNAEKRGVRILYLPCSVTEDSLEITDCIIKSNSDFLTYSDISL